MDRARISIRRDAPSTANVEIVLFSGRREVVLRGGRVERVATQFAFRFPGAVVTAHGERVEPYFLDGATRAAVTDAVLRLWERLRAEVRRPFIEQVVELPPLARPPPREHRGEEALRWE